MDGAVSLIVRSALGAITPEGFSLLDQNNHPELGLPAAPGFSDV